MFDFLTITGAVIITDFLDYQNYEMNRNPVYSTWTDGNLVDHRYSVRTRIEGKATLGFKDSSDFTAFVSSMETAKQADGFYNVEAFVQNTNSTETFEAYIDTEAVSKWDFVNSRVWHEVELTITER